MNQTRPTVSTIDRLLALEAPEDIIDNLRFRRFILEETTQAEKNAIVAYCRLDPAFWVSAFCWAFDPRENQAKIVPFILWPAQKDMFLDIIRTIEMSAEDGVCEKSRDQGASWLFLIAFLWFWLFKPHCAFGVISKDEQSVDKYGDPDSLFWKLDHILSMLPRWMLPEGWNPDDDQCRKRLSIINPENGSVIHGFSCTANAGVGGRKTALFLDEFSLMEDGEAVLSRTSNTTRCRLFNGTHRGLGTAFFKITSVDSTMKKWVLHWTDHPIQSRGMYESHADGTIKILDTTYEFPPDYQFIRTGAPIGGYRPGIRSPYYDQECLRKGSDEEVAKELDIDPIRSTTQFFEPATIYELIKLYCRKPDWSGTLEYDPITGVPKGFQYDPKGDLKLWCSLVDGKIEPAPYAFGMDVSFGVGATPSTISGINCATGEKVMEWASPHMKPEDFAVFVVALARAFTNAVGDPANIAWEYTGPGSSFGNKVLELKFFNIYREQTGGFDGTPGWNPRGHSKENVLTDYRGALKSRMFINRSELALTECLLYSRGTGGKLVHGRKTAKKGSDAMDDHGDRAIADALSWRMARTMGFGEIAELKELDVRTREYEVGTNGWRLRDEIKRVLSGRGRGYWG